jgi:hypothetical protein
MFHVRRWSTRGHTIAFLLLGALAAGCSSDDDGTEPTSQLVGTWNAISFQGLGQDFVAQGMTFRLTLTSSGTYTLVITNDLIGSCDPGPDCSQTGTYSATATQFTLDPGTIDSVTFSYAIQGNTMTFTGSIDGNAVSIQWTRA